MTNVLDEYCAKLSHLETGPGQDIWPATTLLRAPHKPLLLLSVIDLAVHRPQAENFVEPSFELIENFNNYWAAIFGRSPKSGLAEGFLDLATDEIWLLKPRSDQEITGPITTMAQLRDNYLGATLPENLFLLMTREQSRKKLRSTLINQYFNAEIHEQLIDVALVNHGSSLYCEQLISGGVTPRLKTGRGEEINNRLARQGFRKAILSIYDHRCAICGLKIDSPEGRTVVDAVHIIPKEISQDDQPGNGLCLCGTCRWAFENGYMAIGDKYEVMVSPQSRLGGNLPAHLLILPDRIISKPKKKGFKPGHNNLKWHRETIFRD